MQALGTLVEEHGSEFRASGQQRSGLKARRGTEQSNWVIESLLALLVQTQEVRFGEGMEIQNHCINTSGGLLAFTRNESKAICRQGKLTGA
jgi:hypothetical protein